MMLLAAKPDSREAAIAAAADSLRAHVDAGEVRLGAGTWIVEALAPGA